MAPQNEVSIEKAVRPTGVQTSVYCMPPQSEMKELPGRAYGFLSFLKHTFFWSPIFEKWTMSQYIINIPQLKVE